MLGLAGVGLQMGVAEAQQPKKTVPDWLRAEMLKRGINLNADGGKTSSLVPSCAFLSCILQALHLSFSISVRIAEDGLL